MSQVLITERIKAAAETARKDASAQFGRKHPAVVKGHAAPVSVLDSECRLLSECHKRQSLKSCMPSLPKSHD